MGWVLFMRVQYSSLVLGRHAYRRKTFPLNELWE